MIRIALSLLLALAASADEVVLTDGSRLSGTITALSGKGRVTLASPLSFTPFELRAERLDRVSFTATANQADTHDTLVFLTNGDSFPADLLGIDADALKVATAFAGEIRIPRVSVATIQLGMRPRKTIYRGPENDSGWITRTGWHFDNGRFNSDGGGTLARKLELPGSFALRFRVHWRNSPNLQVYFADDSLETTGKADRYYLQFAASGLELKRQQSNDGHPYLSMATIPTEPSDYPDGKLEVELRVDRELGIIHLWLNGQYEDRYADPVKSAPRGQGLMFRSNIGGGDRQSIDLIEVREWDAAADRHGQEERGDPKQDVLITRSSDRGACRIIGMTPGPDGGSIRYQSPHHPAPIDIPVSEVSTLFLARDPAVSESPRPPLLLGLHGRGSLAVGECSFDGDQVSATHPLLGRLTLRRSAIARLTRHADSDSSTEESPEDEP
ncbi:MAG: hypothetical protein EAZ65_06335 [Verrucomicrobia bacterium]|nr:MAG: hypothetical protein EAZ84_11665 [Verrucomicrobiota bacterium]TAE87660.1 MAG: hypothetical protein EAZ82_06800 [Verrucomicrobiota bacterium]TAF25405.1 MAG: hypothetical protein EAZ71_07945 [Verrucomicrobiota bacterium]TAF41192.1 MAG: hypothetical protein EAZ65_06335 [Verrucomicrobiota bacterium]